VQGHLHRLVGVAVVAVVNDVQRFDIGPHGVGEHVVVLGPDGVEVQGLVAADAIEAGDDLLAGALVAAAVDGVEQGFGGIQPGAKNCICLPIAIGETQQAIAVSSPQWLRIW